MLSDLFTHAVYDIVLNRRVYVGTEDGALEFEFSSDRYIAIRFK